MIRRFFALLLFLSAMPVHADDLRPGYMEFTQINGMEWDLIWKAPLKTGITPATQPIVPSPCEIAPAPKRQHIQNAVVTRYKISCSDSIAGGNIGLSNFENSRTDVLIRIAKKGSPVQAMRITAAQPLARIPAKSDGWQVARTYFVTGVDHIIFGYDHLLFVIALLLLLRGFWPVVKAVTAFTIAHSITLIGTSLGLLGLPPRPVEAIIALSILFLAVEIIKSRDGRERLTQKAPWIVAFLFGLLHGFGFAGALKEIGLPQDDIFTALLTFNLGVEAGQIAIVAAAMLILAALRKYARMVMQPAINIATYAIGITASFWFFERVLL